MMKTQLPSYIEYITPREELVSVSEIIFHLLLVAFLAFFLGKIYERYIDRTKKSAWGFLFVSIATLFIVTIVRSSLVLTLAIVLFVAIAGRKISTKQPIELAFYLLAATIGLGIGAGQTFITLICYVVITGFVWLRFVINGGKETKEVADVVSKSGRHLGKAGFKWVGGIILLIVMVSFSFYYGKHFHRMGVGIDVSEWGSSLKSNKLLFVKNYINGLSANPEKISIHINPEQYRQLAYQRELGLTLGAKYITHPYNTGYVPVKIAYNGIEYDAEIRLKGMFADHWGHYKKWSFKIKLNGKATIFGMRKFAIQHPRTRQYLNGWLFNEFLGHSGLIKLRYDFIHVEINNEDFGIYAIEENMDKLLIENNKLRDGPIISFNSDLFWGKSIGNVHYYHSADINLYNEKRVLKNKNLSQQYHKAKSLLEAFRQGRVGAQQVFDTGKFAKLFAIFDLMGFHHGATLDNLKFYYNPVTSLIEPIGYDNPFIHNLQVDGLLGAKKVVGFSDTTSSAPGSWPEDLFNDELFYRQYIAELEKISGQKYLDGLFLNISDEMEAKLQILHSDFPQYVFESKKQLYKNQELIKEYLHPVKGLQVYLSKISDDNNTLFLDISNIQKLPVEVLCITYKRACIYEPKKKLHMQSAQQDVRRHERIDFINSTGHELNNIDFKRLQIKYRILGAEATLEEAIIPWQQLDTNFVDDNLAGTVPNMEEFGFITVDKSSKTIYFQPGNWQITDNLILPEGYSVICNAGTGIDLINNSMILSRSPLQFCGTKDKPIEIYSSDSTGQGLVVIGASDRSELNYVLFSNLSQISHAGWTLTAAVCFYESPVAFTNCSFSDNLKGDDYLNIIRSSFSIESCEFIRVKADALDCDFANGTINQTYFFDIGNDGIDISGSDIIANDVTMKLIGDKGLSAGENSKILATGINISDAEIAVACKDKSLIKINKVNISNSTIGFAVFRKKPEFGAATIKVTGLKIVETEFPFLIEKGSEFSVDNKTFIPDQENVKDLLYGVKYGKSSK